MNKPIKVVYISFFFDKKKIKLYTQFNKWIRSLKTILKEYITLIGSNNKKIAFNN